VQAGVGTKQLNAAVSEAGFYIQSPNAATVGYIPFMLGGGSTWLSGLYGLAVDNLISARVVTATHGLVTASASENADLFWALKGAGQFFGLVTEVTAQMFPYEEKITVWTCIFLPAQIKDVAKEVAALANGSESAKSPGMAAVVAPPGQTKVNPLLLRSIGSAHSYMDYSSP
jgi:FAD/FMN-containing dehydrogenase